LENIFIYCLPATTVLNSIQTRECGSNYIDMKRLFVVKLEAFTT